jgi:hypothetical protein
MPCCVWQRWNGCEFACAAEPLVGLQPGWLYVGPPPVHDTQRQWWATLQPLGPCKGLHPFG